ncbi:MAG: hypothetical protein ABEJ58_01340 [Halodesulfurarchaeum sp.]
MSNPSTTAHETGHFQWSLGLGTLRRTAEAAAFWSAVVLPFVYVPVMLAGLETTNQQLAVVILIAAHVVSLFGGRRYHST